MPDADASIAALKEKFPQVTDRPSADHPAVNVPIAEVVAALTFLRDERGFDLLMDLTAIDWAEGASPRFTVVYHLFSSTQHSYLRVATDCASNTEPSAPTVVGLWPAANWHERECFDLLGVKFTGHPDLRRILMWESYPYHPLRKEFPLAGIEVPLPDSEVTEETGTAVLPAPMQGGPFVASTGEINLADAEPCARDQSWSDRHPRPDQQGLKQIKKL